MRATRSPHAIVVARETIIYNSRPTFARAKHAEWFTSNRVAYVLKMARIDITERNRCIITLLNLLNNSRSSKVYTILGDKVWNISHFCQAAIFNNIICSRGAFGFLPLILMKKSEEALSFFHQFLISFFQVLRTKSFFFFIFLSDFVYSWSKASSHIRKLLTLADSSSLASRCRRGVCRWNCTDGCWPSLQIRILCDF